MPLNNSFLASTLSETKKGTKKSPRGRPKNTDKIVDNNKKRGRVAAQLNSSANESFINQRSHKNIKGEDDHDPSSMYDSDEQDSTIPAPMESPQPSISSFFTRSGPSSTPAATATAASSSSGVDKKVVFSTPIRSKPALNETPIELLNQISEVSTNMHNQLRGELASQALYFCSDDEPDRTEK